MPVSDAERLRAAGHVVNIGDEAVPLVFDFAACLLLEKEFGGFAQISLRLRWGGGHVLSDIETFLTCGLTHAGKTRQEVRDGIRLEELKAYQSAIVDAIAEAFPGDEGKAEGEAASGLSGTVSSTSPPSATAEVLSSSGV